MWWRPWAFAVIVALAAGAPAGASSFTLETSAFLNGGDIPRTDAAAAGACGGRNLSPPLHWSGFPAADPQLRGRGFDPDAGHGHGFVHWVAYGIAPAVRRCRRASAPKASPAFTGGVNDAGTTHLLGALSAARRSAAPLRLHRVRAGSRTRGSCGPGLTRAALLRAIAAHTLAQAQITGRFAR